MLAILLTVLIQAAAPLPAPGPTPGPPPTPISTSPSNAPSTSSSTPQRFSILVDPCAAASKAGNDVVVCGAPAVSTPRLPMRDDRGPSDHAIASNPDLSAARALSLSATPCAATQWGCPSSFGPPIVPIAKAAVGLVKSAFAKKPDKTGRVPIDLDGPVGTVN